MEELILLKKKLAEISFCYVPIENNESIIKIYNLFVNDIKFEPLTGIECNYMGVYYSEIVLNYDESEKYYLMAIDYGITIAMHNLAVFFKDLKKIDLAKKYFLMAIEFGSIPSIHRLASLYENLEEHENAEKYYLMAIQHGYVKSMNFLADFYKNIKNDDINSVKYHRMAAENGNVNSIDWLISYYKNDDINCVKYHIMAAENEYMDSISWLIKYYKNFNVDNVEKYYLMLIKKHSEYIIDLSHYFLFTKNDPTRLLKICIKNLELIQRKHFIKIVVNISGIKLDINQHKYFVKFLSSYEFLPEDDIPQLLRTLINSLQYHVNIMKLHFEYTVNGKGFKEARNDFLNSIK